MHKQTTIKDMICRFAQAPDGAVAFSLYDGVELKNISYPIFVSDLLKAANYFVSQNMVRQHIAIAAPNSYQWILAYFAITASGNTAVLLNPNLPIEILKDQCFRADVSLICGDEDTISGFAQELSEFRLIDFSQIASEYELPFSGIYETDADETITMIYTSGTTGKSKIVELTAENMKYRIEDIEPCFADEHAERQITPVPFFHMSGLNVFLGLLNQHKTECLGRGIKYLFQDLPILNPTAIDMVPSIADSLLKLLCRAKNSEDRAKLAGNRLKRLNTSGAALNTTTSSLLRDLDLEVLVVYAMSESGMIAWTLLDDVHIGTTGKFCKNVEYAIRDGELLLRGPSLMKGYYKNPEETKKAIVDGWLHTGDLARVDEDGYLYITGRKKNIIILSNGENVNPEEIEEKLGASPDIIECMVYSDGKGICADVFTENASEAAAFISSYNAEMPMYRQVYKVNYMDKPLEKTGSGKIKRKENVYA